MNIICLVEAAHIFFLDLSRREIFCFLYWNWFHLGRSLKLLSNRLVKGLFLIAFDMSCMGSMTERMLLSIDNLAALHWFFFILLFA
jgi:hypothetical protein